jgi:YVTN family beta-propeller protein
MAKRTRPWPARNPICIATLDEHGNAVCACPPTPPAPADESRYDDALGVTLLSLLGRRRFLTAAAGGATSLMLAACGASQAANTATTGSSTSAAAVASRSTALTTSSLASAATTASSASSSAASALATTSSAMSTSSSASLAATSSTTASTTISTSVATTSSASAAAASSTSGAQWVYVFNVGSQDVTILDAATNKVLATRPLGAAVRWLSDEQRYWDGQRVWTYDFPDNKLEAIAIDPKTVQVVERIDTGTLGPGHSLMLTPDFKSAYVNAAGSNVINVIDVASKAVRDKIAVNAFPCDCHLTPDGKFGFTPERDADSVAKFDTSTNKIVKRMDFPKGSKPYMLRVSPDGKEVWVQAAGNNTNNIVDPDAMTILHSEADGQSPVTNAWSPDGKYVLLTHEKDETVTVYDAATQKVLKKITVGQDSTNIGFTPDSKKAFIAVSGANTVAVIDMTSLTVITQVKAGKSPQGLIVMPAPEGGLS